MSILTPNAVTLECLEAGSGERSAQRYFGRDCETVRQAKSGTFFLCGVGTTQAKITFEWDGSKGELSHRDSMVLTTTSHMTGSFGASGVQQRTFRLCQYAQGLGFSGSFRSVRSFGYRVDEVPQVWCATTCTTAQDLSFSACFHGGFRAHPFWQAGVSGGSSLQCWEEYLCGSSDIRHTSGDVGLRRGRRVGYHRRSQEKTAFLGSHSKPESVRSWSGRFRLDVAETFLVRGRTWRR